MMKILLVAINAKYVQTNLAVRLLKAFAETSVLSVNEGRCQIGIGEWNINQSKSAIVRGIWEAKPDAVLFSVYIWNRDFTFQVASELRKILPDVLIGFGGPEVSWSASKSFSDCPAADLIIAGEGELTLAELLARLDSDSQRLRDIDFSGITGLYARRRGPGTIAAEAQYTFGGTRPSIENLDVVPFPYDPCSLDFDPKNRIVYYESSRGCPFSCAYCLSSIDRSVRYYPLDRVLRELEYFMAEGFPLVKFVDRTFNLNPDRYIAIWEFIRDHHNGKTLFHFEIAAEYLADAAFKTLETMPPGAIQLEIGVQSINPETLKIVGRPAHPDQLAESIRRIPKSIHTHVDLIAGLPAENLASFARSFDFAFALDADMLQLGFLKVLAGSPMESLAHDTPGFIWSDQPPYEVLSTPDLPYEDTLILKDVERVLDTWFNSGLMRNTLNELIEGVIRRSAFDLFRSLSSFIRTYYPDRDLYLPRRPADSFACMAAFLSEDGSVPAEWLKYDYLLQGKPGVFPEWYNRDYEKELHEQALMDQGLLCVGGESRRAVFARTEFERFQFSPGAEKIAILFVYPNVKNNEKKARCIRL